MSQSGLPKNVWISLADFPITIDDFPGEYWEGTSYTTNDAVFIFCQRYDPVTDTPLGNIANFKLKKADFAAGVTTTPGTTWYNRLNGVAGSDWKALGYWMIPSAQPGWVNTNGVFSVAEAHTATNSLCDPNCPVCPECPECPECECEGELLAPDFNLNVQIYIIEEVLNGVPTILPQWDFTTEAFAQGYIDTFGAGRDLRIVHFVKVKDSARDKVPAGTPTVWICQKTNTDGSKSYMGNPHLTESNADFWTGIFGGPNATYATKMLSEYPV